jgi:class 3 adenylate cyclase/tetratricopeptide (TPR) repeat protein
MTARTGVFDPYVSRVVSDWDRNTAGERWQSIDGSLVFVDISGFTNLSEKLARRGRIGAEELTSVLSRVFGNMLDVAYSCGGSLLKFGGDALLLLFDNPEHVVSAVGAAVEMRTALRESAKIPTSVGKIPLRMSVGVHTGPIDLFLVGDSHRELIITGPTASVTTEMEGTADAGEIAVSSAIKDALPSGYTGAAKGNGWTLRKRSIPFWKCGPILRHPISDDEMERFVPAALRPHLRSGLRESEHRVATVGFLKFKGIDALMKNGGPRRVGEALDELVRIVQREADAEGVTFLATDVDADGGKIILVAGVPGSQEDDEGRVLRAARRILDAEPPLAIRLGVNRGHVFAGDVGTDYRSTYTIMGDTVNLAARLMAAADPGSLYASPGVIDLSATLFRTEALEPFFVKGKEKPVQAFELFEDVGTRPPESRHELPFMGRDAEIDVLIEAMAEVKEGSGRSITINADTGIGKTRLLQEFRSLVPDSSWFTVRGEPHGKDIAYFALRDPLRSLLGIERGPQVEMVSALRKAVSTLVPDLAPFAPLLADVAQLDMEDTSETADIEPRFRPGRTADIFVALLESIFDGVTVLAFDDAHWLDEASLALVEKIDGVAHDRPWMVLTAARAGESEGEPIGEVLPLEPLDPEDSREIVVESTRSTPLRPAEVDNVVARSGGNPLFLSEIIKVVRETGQATDLPDSLDSVVSSQIDQLPPLTKQVMRYSSVLGRSFRRDVLEELLAPEGLELDQATRRDLARYVESEGRDRLRFSHAVVHDIAYQGLSYHRRQELHTRAGLVIERLAGDDPESVAEILATHFSEGGEHERAWRYGVIAGDRARARYSMTEAAAQYQIAVDASRRLDTIGDEESGRILECLGDVCDTSGRYAEAEKAYQAARDKLASDLAAQGRLMSKLGLIREKAGQLPVALRWFRRGLKLVEGVPDATESIVDLSLAYGGIRFRQGRFHDTIGWCRSVLDRDDLTDKQRAHALYLIVTAYAHVGSPEAVPAAEEAIEIYDRIGDLVGLGNVLNNLGVHAYYRGDWDQALDLWSRSESARRRAGDLSGAAASVNNLAEVYSDQGKVTEAEPMFRTALYEWESSGIVAGVGLALLNLGRALTRLGRLDEAAVEFEKGLQVFQEMGAQALFARRFEEARDLSTRVLRDLADDPSTFMQRAALHRVLGFCAVSGADLATVERELRESLDDAIKADSEFETALTLESLVRLLPDHPDRTSWNDDQEERLLRLGVIATPVVPVGK